ncbi:stromal cell-derived factor 2 [Hermetia illucens]|nr:stromal cell-derived factor 2 [Hermetia illucens]
MKSASELTYLLVKLIVLLGFTQVHGSKSRHVTCGTVLKLLNADYDVRLHSHDVKYGSGSGQQSVTGTEIKEDVNSHWVIKAAAGKTCERGQPIQCGYTIRLEHLNTKKNLHSHYFSSPLSGNQEISCYGNDGVGDSGDHWEVICSGDEWLRDSSVKFRHVDTGSYLGVSGRTFGRPINGQMEVVGFTNPQHGSTWKAAEGLFIMPKESKAYYPHTEL